MHEDIKKRPVEIDDLFRLKSITEAQLSPDGKSVVFTISLIDKEKEEELSALWLLSIESGENRQLTSGVKTDYSPVWSPVGEKIAFISTRAEKPQIYILAVGGGEAQKLTDLKQGVGGGPKWSPDGTKIAFTASKPIEPADPKDPYRVTRHIYRFDGIGYLEPAIQDIFMVSVENGEVKGLTDDEWNNTSPRWSPDGQEILFISAFAPDSHSIHSQMKIVNLAGEIREPLPGWGAISEAHWSADGKQIIFIGQVKDQPMGTKNDLWVLGVNGGEPVCRTKDLDVGVGGDLQGDFPAAEAQGETILTSDGSFAYSRVQNGGSLGLYKVALSGGEAWEPVVFGKMMVSLKDLNDKHLLYLISTINEPGDLFIADINGKNEKRLTEINDEALSKWAFPAIERLIFKSKDSQPVEGWVMKPPQGEPPYATILYIHGGPTGAFGNIFAFDFHMLAGAGYAVLFINPRGSSGYGNDFATAITADWGNLDYQDVMAGVDHLVAAGIADPERLGVAGLSYGGYMSCWIVGQTDRFKAAVPENPVTNLVSLYGTSDISANFLVTGMTGKPHEVPEIYSKCSPITYAHNCTTPTLLIQGEADYRCPVEQGEQFYAALKANGCPVEMLRLPGCSHVGTITGAPIIRRAQNEALLDWMNRYVMGVTSEE
ncbi:MAG: S9 family peptidase [Anaerolineaceae bacterium]|nr:S9 family peptidase [Anaerolineaceae bacterium]